ncbi:YadA-like family protein [Basilea psittacipulmonis]|uniref:YadA-like family protein n=1 Tax=Basilea psittacipulmonis TaxID=1472345 RepID=UPI001F3E5BCE|nr:YadA-like family protein [Basilea psittacipulmonis]
MSYIGSTNKETKQINIKTEKLKILGGDNIVTKVDENGKVVVSLSSSTQDKLNHIPTDSNAELNQKADANASNIDVSAWQTQLGALSFKGDLGNGVDRRLGENPLPIKGGASNTVEGLISVQADGQELTLKLAKQLDGLNHVQTEKLKIAKDDGEIILSASDKTHLNLSANGGNVTVTHLKAGTNANSGLVYGQLTALANSVVSAIGTPPATIGDASHQVAINKGSTADPQSISSLIEQTKTQSDQKIVVKQANESYGLTVTSKESTDEQDVKTTTYTVTGKDWTQAIQDKKTQTQSEILAENALKYQANGTSKKTSLQSGLNFVNGANTEASWNDNGITYSVEGDLTGIESITLTQSRDPSTQADYGQGENAGNAATQAAVQQVYAKVLEGWNIAGENGSTTPSKLATGSTVRFVNGSGATVSVAKTANQADQVDVAYHLQTKGLSVTDGGSVTVSDTYSQTAPGYATADSVAKAVSDAVRYILDETGMDIDSFNLRYKADSDETAKTVKIATGVFGVVSADNSGLSTTADDKGQITLTLDETLQNKIDHLPEDLTTTISQKTTVIPSVEAIDVDSWRQQLGKMTVAGDAGNSEHLLGSSLSITGGASSDLLENSIAVSQSSTDTLNVKLAKNLNGLTSVESEQLSINGITIQQDNDAVKLSGQNDAPVSVTNIKAEADNDAATVANLKTVKDTIKASLGSEVSEDPATGQLTLSNGYGVNGATSIADALGKAKTEADKKTVVKAGKDVTVAYDSKTDTYTVSSKDWSATINQAVTDLNNQYDKTELSYRKDGETDIKKVDLGTGLTFVSGANLIASSQTGGQVNYALTSELTGIEKVSGLTARKASDADSYGTGDHISRGATEAAVKEVYDLANNAWNIAANDELGTKLAPAKTVSFVDANGTKATVNVVDSNATVKIDINTGTLTHTTDNKLAVASGDERNYVTSDNLAKVLNTAVKNLSNEATISDLETTLAKVDASNLNSDTQKTAWREKLGNLSYQGDHDITTITRMMGETLNLKGGATELTDGNIGIIYDEASKTFKVQLAKTLKDLASVATGTLKVGNDDNILNIAMDDELGSLNLTSNGGSSVKIENIADGTQSSDLITMRQLSELKTKIGGATPQSSQDSPAGKDGLDGKSAADQLLALRNGLAGNLVYVDEEGNRLTLVNGVYYRSSEVTVDEKGQTMVSGAAVSSDSVRLAAVNALGSTQAPISLNNIASGLDITDKTALSVNEAKSKLKALNAEGLDVSQAATVGDLQVLAQAGLDFKANTGDTIHRPLGTSLTIKGDSTITDTSAFDASYLEVNGHPDNGLIVKLSNALTGLTSVTTKTLNLGQHNPIAFNKKAGENSLVLGAENEPVRVTNVQAGTADADAVTKAQLDQLKNKIGDVSSATIDNASALAQDGLNGKSLNDQILALRQGSAGTVIYTTTTGERLVRVGSSFYLTRDIDEKGQPKSGVNAVSDDQVILSLVNANGGTTDPIVLRHVASALGLDSVDQISQNAQTQVANLLKQSGHGLTQAVTVADLRAVVETGVTFAGNQGTLKRGLAQTLTLQGEEAGSDFSSAADNIAVVADNDNLTLKLAANLIGLKQVQTKTLKIGDSTTYIKLSADDGVLNVSDANDKPVQLKNIAESDDPTALATRKQLNRITEIIGSPSQVGKSDPTSPAGKDGLDGKSATDQLLALREGLAGNIVYTTASGQRLMMIDGEYYLAYEGDARYADNLLVQKEGKWYKASDLNADGSLKTAATEVIPTKVDSSSVVLSAVNANGDAGNQVITLSNVASAIGGEPSSTAVDRVQNLLSISGAKLNHAANVADLQTVAQAGMDFVGNDDQSVHVNLGESLTLKGQGNRTTLSNNDTASGNIWVSADTSALLIRLAKDLQNLKSAQFVDTTSNDTPTTTVSADGISITKDTTTVSLKSSGFDAGNQAITNVKAPEKDNDASTKSYVEQKVGNVNTSLTNLKGKMDNSDTTLSNLSTEVEKGWKLSIDNHGETSSTEIKKDSSTLTLNAGNHTQLTHTNGAITIATDVDGITQDLMTDALPMIYQDGSGKQVFKVMKNGKEVFNTKADGTGKEVSPEVVSVALKDPSATGKALNLTQVASGLGLNQTTPIAVEEAQEVVLGKTVLQSDGTQKTEGGLMNARGSQLKQVVNVADVQAVAQAGLTFAANSGNFSHKALGGQIKLKGKQHVDLSKYNTANVITTVDQDGNIVIKLAKSQSSINMRAKDTLVVGRNDEVTGSTKGTVMVKHDESTGKGTIYIKGADGQDGKDAIRIEGDSLGNGMITLNGEDVKTQINNQAVVITPSSADPTKEVFLSNRGLNNGGNRITNVSPGIDDTDALTLGQLLTSSQPLQKKISDIRKSNISGLSAATAFASLNKEVKAGENLFSVGISNYRGQTAMAIGVTSVSDDGKRGFRVMGSSNSSSGDRVGAVSAFYTIYRN